MLRFNQIVQHLLGTISKTFANSEFEEKFVWLGFNFLSVYLLKIVILDSEEISCNLAEFSVINELMKMYLNLTAN